MGDVPLGPAPTLPAPLTLPELDAIRSNEGQVEVYRSLRSLMEQHNAVVGYLRKTSGRGVLQQSAGPLLASGRATACSITLYWQTRGDGFAPQFYQVWQADAGTTAAPTMPSFDAAIRTTRIPSELNTPLIVRSRFVWTDKDFTSTEITAGERRAYWITAIDVDGNESLPVAIGPLAPGACSGGGGAATDEILIVADMSAGDLVVTLPDPATLPSLTTVINVKVQNGGFYLLHIDPGVGNTIDGFSEGIDTRTDNQGYRFRWGPSADENPPADGWLCIETAFGGDESGGPAGGTPPTLGVAACDATLPYWITTPAAAADYQVLTDASGVYTKPDGHYSFVAVVGFGSGAGAGSGYNQNAGDYSSGGTGGGGGARKIQFYAYDAFPTSVTYAIHQGGAGGAASTTGGVANDGLDGGSATLTETVTGDIFSVGGGLKGLKGHTLGPNDLGGQGGSWDQNGTAVADNGNGTSGDGGGAIRGGIAATPKGCAECGGGAGAGEVASSVFLIDGGSSVHGGGGGGFGGVVGVAPLNLFSGSDGGAHSTDNGGGGGAGATDGQAGSDGSVGSGLDGGSGGGGGYPAFTPTHSGDGGVGGVPGGGGGGGAAGFGGGEQHPGSGGSGARGELRIYVI